MLTGPLAGKIMLFAIPLMLSSILQLCFNAADTIVVGRYAGETSLAAVGACASLINLIINAFLGLSVGVSVRVAHAWGAKLEKEVGKITHTAVAVAFAGGIGLTLVGVIGCRYFLTWMGTPDDVITLATLYMRIYFLGMPANMVYNFSASVLRSLGDTKRPMIFLIIAGVVNVILNLITVIFFDMGVAGVAIATVVSQCVSCALILGFMASEKSPCRLRLKELRIDKAQLIAIARIGLPAGLQATIFSVSNVIIQSSLNSFGSTAIAGNTAAVNLEAFVYMAMNAFYHASLTFVGQNVGAGQYKRVKRIVFTCLIIVTSVGVVTGTLMCVFRYPLLAIYRPNAPEVWEYGARRMLVILTTYFTCGIMEVLTGAMRGMGASLLPMAISLLGVCGIRIVWVFTVFQQYRSIETLYASYPISWVGTILVQIFGVVWIYRKTAGKGKKTEETE